jgi:hypothetical protein
MLRLITVTAVALVIGAARVDARLWETKAEISARFGKPLRVDRDPAGDLYTYSFQQLNVVVTFLDGKSQSELYHRSDLKGGLTQQQIHQILSINTLRDTSWQTSEGIFVLVRKAGGHPIAVGAYSSDASPPILGISTADFVKKSGWLPGNQKKIPH